jgi:hypothetical protein
VKGVAYTLLALGIAWMLYRPGSSGLLELPCAETAPIKFTEVVKKSHHKRQRTIAIGCHPIWNVADWKGNVGTLSWQLAADSCVLSVGWGILNLHTDLHDQPPMVQVFTTTLCLPKVEVPEPQLTILGESIGSVYVS